MSKFTKEQLNLINEVKEGKKLTWYELAVKYDIRPNESKKKRETAANDIWRRFLKQKSNLELTKEIYRDGKLHFETFKKKPVEEESYNKEDFEIDRITTNPYGGAWFKLKKKEGIYNDEHYEKLREILVQEIEPQTYSFYGNENDKACMVYTSDKHIGALTKDNSVYKNKYDKDEMRERIVFKVLEGIEKQVLIHGNFKSLFIMDLGDALDGFNQKTTGGLRGTSSHTLPQQMNNREQHDFYVQLHKELFDYIVKAKYAENIYFIATSNSNHGGDFEYGAMKNLETYLNIKYPFIETFVNHKPYNHFIFGKHAIIFGHGKDDEDMKHGLPLTLNDKVENYLNDYIEKNKLSDYFVTVVTGDLHQSSLTYGKKFRYVKVLSQYGSSKWMHTHFGSGSPGLSIEIVDYDTNTVSKSDIFYNVKNESNTGIEFK